MKPTPPKNFLRKHLRLLLLSALSAAVALTIPTREAAPAKIDPKLNPRPSARHDDSR